MGAVESSLRLRPYQDTCVQQVFQAMRAGYRSVLLCCPTGSGKRIMAMWLMDYAAKNQRRVLFVGNRRLLVTQAASEAKTQGVSYGVIMADMLEGNPGSSNQIASIHSLERWYFYEKWTKNPTGEGLPPADLIIIDECHQCLDKYAQLRAFYPEAKVLGLTATPVGPQGRSLAPSPFEVLIEPVKNSWLVQEGWLLPTQVYAPSEPYLDGIKVINREEYSQKALGRRVKELTVFADVFAEWESKGGREMATVVFVPGVAYGHDLARQFNFLLGPGHCHVIEAKTKPQEREYIFSAISDQARGVLVSVDVLREGFDLPVLQAAIDLQPNQQLRTYWQKLGRIKRPSGTQSQAILLDFAGNYWRFPHPNEDPEWPEGDEDTQAIIKRKREAGQEAQPIMCPKCSFVRNRGDTCPNCGLKAAQAIRRIRMGNGRLREIPAVEARKRELSQEERLFSKWQGRLFAALKSGLTYGQCARLFREETGHYPQDGWPGVFEKGSLAWKRRPKDQFTTRDLAIACRQHKERLRA